VLKNSPARSFVAGPQAVIDVSAVLLAPAFALAWQPFSDLDGREVKLVACSGGASRPPAAEAVMDFQMGKAHLDLAAFVA
jgi:hypothetical protein